MKTLLQRSLVVCSLLFLGSLASAQTPAPGGNVGVAVNPSNAVSFLHTDAGGNLLTLGTTTISGPVSGAVTTAVTPALAAAALNLDASGNLLVNGAGGIVVLPQVFVRPSNATPYVLNEVVGTSPAALITITGAARVNGGNGWIQKVRLNTNSVTVAAATFRIYFYHTAPTAIADQAAFTLLYANASYRIGYVDLPTMNTEGTGSDSANAQVYPVNLPFTCDAGSTTIYAVVVAKDAYVPASAQSFTLETSINQN